MIINGFRVLVAPDYKVANVQLIQGLLVSGDFRKDFDEWLMDFFGYKIEETLQDGEVVHNGNYIIANAKTVSEIRKMANETL